MNLFNINHLFKVEISLPIVFKFYLKFNLLTIIVSKGTKVKTPLFRQYLKNNNINNYLFLLVLSRKGSFYTLEVFDNLSVILVKKGQLLLIGAISVTL